jgi:hypothetical protein
VPARRDLVPWAVRALWAVLPFTLGPTLAGVLSETSVPVRTLSSVGLWAAWTLGLLAACVPHPLALTALRVLAPGAAVVSVGAAVGEHPSALAVGWAVVAGAWAFAPAFGEWCVNGPAYPNERRHLLRAPGPGIAGVLGIGMAWGLALGGLCSGPVLLAARQWVAGAVVTAVGWAVAALFLRSLHGLSRRWVVFVPAGIVIHDPVSLRDPVLLPRRLVTGVRAAEAKADAGDAIDLTQRAVGLAVVLHLREPTAVTLMKPGQQLGVQAEALALAIMPTRPGAVLAEARSRSFAAGG